MAALPDVRPPTGFQTVTTLRTSCLRRPSTAGEKQTQKIHLLFAATSCAGLPTAVGLGTICDTTGTKRWRPQGTPPTRNLSACGRCSDKQHDGPICQSVTVYSNLPSLAMDLVIHIKVCNALDLQLYSNRFLQH